MGVKISDIRVVDRIRQDNGDLSDLTESIKTHGLINPITIMEADDGYILIAGFRRLCAAKSIGWETIEATIKSPMDAEEQLRIEIEENETRKAFTVSEKVAYGKKLEAIEKAKGVQRKSEHARDGYRTEEESSQDRDARPYPETGRRRDIIASKVGFSSGKQLERATYVADHRPDLMDEIDTGTKTIYEAYNEAKGISKKPRAVPSKPSTVDIPANMGIVHGLNGNMLGHIDAKFNRPDGFPFVLDEVKTAAQFYLAEIRQAAGHYTSVMQTPENSKAVSALLRETFYQAADLFGDNYIEEDNI